MDTNFQTSYDPFRRGRKLDISTMCSTFFGGIFAQMGWCFFGFGMIFAGVFVGNADLSALNPISPTYRELVGTVVSTEHTGASVNDREVIGHRFRYSLDGKVHTGISYSSTVFRDSGSQVSILVPDDPNKAVIKGMGRSQFGAWVVLVLIFPLIGLCFLLPRFLSGFWQCRVLKFGKLVLGVLKDTKRTNVSINDEPVYELVYEFTAEDGRKHNASARTIEVGGKEQGSQAQVLYSPRQPEKALLIEYMPGRPYIDGNRVIGGKKAYWYAALPLLCVLGHVIYFSL